VPAAGRPSNYYVRLHHPRQTEGGLTRRTSARLLFDGDDAVLSNTFRRPSRRGHRSLPAAAARFLCGQTLRLRAANKFVQETTIRPDPRSAPSTIDITAHCHWIHPIPFPPSGKLHTVLPISTKQVNDQEY